MKYSDLDGNNPLIFIGVGVALLSYFTVTAINHGHITVDGVTNAIFWGFMTSEVSFGVGEATSTISSFVLKATTESLLHGATQGGIASLQGGKFWNSFAAGSISSLAASSWTGGGQWDGIGSDFAQSSIGTIAFGAISGGAGNYLTGGDFWQGAVTGLIVSGFNHALHDGDSYEDVEDDSKPKIKAIPKELQAKIDRLRVGFEFLEDYGGYVEIAGLVLAPFTAEASLGVAGVGMAFTAVGTTGNTILDLIEYKYTNDPAKLTSAKNRAIKYGLTLGTGKALGKLTFNFTDKLITKFLDITIDKSIYTTVLPTTKSR